MRTENYIHLRDSLAKDTHPSSIGQKVILPSSYVGSPRYMHERTQDTMAYVRKYGRPDLFITFTCNPNWPEITDNLFQSQSTHHRHDIVARVFKLKQKQLLRLLKGGEVFGKLNCWMLSIEWQKHGLPHSHTLIWCQHSIRAEDIDKLISAELPDETSDPDLFHAVSKNMVHGPCGFINPAAPCMKNGKCTKKFPKDFINATQTTLMMVTLFTSEDLLK